MTQAEGTTPREPGTTAVPAGRGAPLPGSGAPTDASDLDRGQLIQQIRRQFGVTQAKLAVAMGVSAKAIQSYEQGWRRVPSRALVQLLVLLAIHRRRQVDIAPCWEITHCPPETRKDCPSYAIGDGQFCWFVAAGHQHCPAASATDGEDFLLPCIGCEVVRRLLREVSPGEATAGGGE